VGFTRNPATGKKEFYGDSWSTRRRGRGRRHSHAAADRELERVMPKAYKQLRAFTTKLERHYRDVQDFEFTIQDERLFMLQTRSGKRTGARRRDATDLVASGSSRRRKRSSWSTRVAQPAAAQASIRRWKAIRPPPRACRLARRCVRAGGVHG